MKIINRPVTAERSAEPLAKARLVDELGLSSRIRLQVTCKRDARIESARRLLVMPVVQGDEIGRVVAELVERSEHPRGQDAPRFGEPPRSNRDRRRISTGEEILAVEIFAPLLQFRVTRKDGKLRTL